MSTTPLQPATGPAGLNSTGADPCTYCGALLAADQRYCLGCGARRGDARVDYSRLLAAEAAARAASAARAGTADVVPSPEPGARTVSPLGAAAGLGLLLLAVLVGAVIGGGREATPAAPIVLPAATTPAQAQVTEFVSNWTGDDGWTVQVQLLPKDSTTPQQVIDAKSAAIAAGAPAVGALDSDEYASLDPGSYVIYSGVFASRKDAREALDAVKASFPDAKVLEVSATADEADAAADADAGTAADSALEALENASPEDYAEKSKKLPDELGTGGDALPTDNKAPGGGSDDALVIE